MNEIKTSVSASSTQPELKPLYLQIKDILIQRLVKGEWGPGEMLPSELRLAAEYNVHQGTVRKAIEEMAAQNLVVRQQGKGTFVATAAMRHSPYHFFRLRSKSDAQEKPRTQFVSCTRAPASAEERAHLEMQADWAEVVRSVRLRLFDEVPVVVERVASPADIFPGLDELLMEVRPATTYALFEEKYRVLIVHVVERLTAVAASSEDAAFLGVDAGTPLLQIERLAHAIDGRVVEWRVSRCTSDAHEYVVDLR